MVVDEKFLTAKISRSTVYQELRAKMKRLYTVQRELTVPKREYSYCAIIVQCRVQSSTVNATWLCIVTPTRISYGFINVSPISCIYTESIISLNSLVMSVQFLAVSRALDEHNELIVIGVILNNPTLYLDELCQTTLALTDVSLSPSTVCRMMRRYGITRKRVRQIALQQCDALCGAFMAYCSPFARNQFVWVDETGSDKRDHVRRYGFSIQGTTPVTHRLFSRGQRVNAIAVVSTQ